MKQYREIPYNYTSFSDKEIVCRFLGEDAWELLNQLRQDRNTGRSSRMLFEVLGDMWVVDRNPYLQEDLIKNKRRWQALIEALYSRLDLIRNRVNGNQKVLELLEQADDAVAKFKQHLSDFKHRKKHIKQALLKVTSDNNIRFDALSRASDPGRDRLGDRFERAFLPHGLPRRGAPRLRSHRAGQGAQ